MNIKKINLASSLLIFVIFFQSISAESISFKPEEEKLLLADEVFNKLSQKHYVQEWEDGFNYKYIEYLIDELDGDKRYFTKSEVARFLNSAKYFNNSKHEFDLKAAYKIINLYFNRLIEFSEYQIKLIKKEDFSFDGSDFLDIYAEDNVWQASKSSL